MSLCQGCLIALKIIMSREEQETSYLSESQDESATSLNEGSSIVTGGYFPLSNRLRGTGTDATKPPTITGDSGASEFTNAKNFQDFITNHHHAVPISPFVLTTFGLPSSLKTASLEKAFCVKPSAERRFTHHEIVVGRISKEEGDQTFFDVTIKDESFLLAVFSGLAFKNKGKILFSLDSLCDCTFQDEILRSYMSSMVKKVPEIWDARIYELLKNGIGLVNLWDTSLNKRTRPFLECIASCLKRSFLWLFVDLDEDLHNLHTAPESTNGDEKSMQWRSRIEYLLRTCQLCKNSQYMDDEKSKVCTIFATYSSKKVQNREEDKKFLRKKMKNAAKQIGCRRLIDLDIVLIDKEGDESYFKKLPGSKLKKLYEKVQRKPIQIPLSWILLRGHFKDSPDFYITYNELKEKAFECGFSNEEEINKFCSFFNSFGSIFDLRQVTKDLNFIIVQPSKFLSLMDLILEPKEDGIITLKEDDNRNEFVVMEILVSLALALKPESLQTNNSDHTYYVRSIRMGNRKMYNSYSPGAVQFILSMGSPRVDFALRMARYLLENLPKPEFDLSAIEHINSIAIKTTAEDDSKLHVVLASQGDVVEISITGWQESINKHADNICKTIVKGTKHIIPDEITVSPDVQYHFAIQCKHEKLKGITPFFPFQVRHVLPFERICKECEEEIKDLRVIESLNKALKENEIPEERKLNGGELSSSNVSTIAEGMGEYPEEAISLLAKKLNVEKYFNEKKGRLKPKALAMGIIVEWQSTPDAVESPRKALARHLMELNEEWKCQAVPFCKGLKMPKFSKLARELDIRVCTPDQIENVRSQRSRSLGCLDSMSAQMHGKDKLERSLDESGMK